jgi:predicted nucleotidyltransferase
MRRREAGPGVMSKAVPETGPRSATAAARRLRSLATDAVQPLSRDADVVGVRLVGSVARGDARPDSDIDLLIIATQPLNRSTLLQRLPAPLRRENWSFLIYTDTAWLGDAQDGSLFLEHVRLEGETLYDPDGVIEQALEALSRRGPDADAELRRRLRQLRLYRDLARLNGQHLFALSHLYAVGKAVAIARCAQLGKTTFVKDDALASMAELRPELSEEAEVISRLRPFYDRTGGRYSGRVPFEPVDADAEIERAIAAIQRLANA